jgi:hypothetical protein
MLTVVPGQTQSSSWQRANIRALFGDWLRAFAGLFRTAYFIAFPLERCDAGLWLIAMYADLHQPAPVAPASAAAFTGGALLYEVDGEPCSGNFIA